MLNGIFFKVQLFAINPVLIENKNILELSMCVELHSFFDLIWLRYCLNIFN